MKGPGPRCRPSGTGAFTGSLASHTYTHLQLLLLSCFKKAGGTFQTLMCIHSYHLPLNVGTLMEEVWVGPELPLAGSQVNRANTASPETGPDCGLPCVIVSFQQKLPEHLLGTREGGKGCVGGWYHSVHKKCAENPEALCPEEQCYSNNNNRGCPPSGPECKSLQ